MDNALLRQFEDLLANAQRDAEATEDHGFAPGPWGVWPASVFESFGAVTDMLARSTGAFPNNAHYVREKTGALLAAVTYLYDKVMSTPVCGHEEPEGVEDDGSIYAWDCGRIAGHHGEHEPNPVTRRLEQQTHEVLDRARTLSAGIRWTLLTDGETFTADSRHDIDKTLSDLRRELGALTELVDKIPTSDGG